MSTQYDLSRFLDAQERIYDLALLEIKRGRKVSHWIWFIFPQIAGFRDSRISKYYAVKNLDEAKAYLQNGVLCRRLIEISEALLEQNGSIRYIFGPTDDIKVGSCMTLFREVDPGIEVFQKVLDKFFDGQPDISTMNIIAEMRQGTNT